MIKFEDFNKLKQLDRIEYMLHLKRIEEENDYSLGTYFLFPTAFILMLFVLTFLGTANLIGLEKSAFILYTGTKIFIVLMAMTLIGIVIDIGFHLRGKMWKKQLEETYFKKEVKAR